MPIEVIQQITAWSFSRWKDYEKCPRFAKYKHVEKLKTPGSAAMDRGGAIDKSIERYLKEPLSTLPSECNSFKKEFSALKKLKPLCQQDWAFDSSWIKCDWFGAAAWLRVKMDAAKLVKKVAKVIDFKTGKQYDDHRLQLELYALAAFLVFPAAEVVESNLWYTDLGKEDPVTFKRGQLHTLQEAWLNRIATMMKDKRFAPRPGNHCSYCPFSNGKGGPCEY